MHYHNASDHKFKCKNLKHYKVHNEFADKENRFIFASHAGH